MRKIFLSLLFLLAVFLEASISTFPLILIVGVVFYVLTRSLAVFPYIFFPSLLLDVLLADDMGKRGVFLILFFLVVVLYERKFEVETVQFVFFAAFLGTVFYQLFFGVQALILEPLLSGLLAATCFLIASFVTRKKNDSYFNSYKHI